MNKLERDIRAEWRRLRAEYPDRLMGCSFKVNGRFKSKLGVCRSRRVDGMPVSVELARFVVADEAMREQAFDTLYHEVAHALAGHAAGHGPAWKAMCRKLGAQPERLANMTTDQRAVAERVNPHRWEVGCEKCNVSAKRHRLATKVKVHGRCGTCGGGLYFKDLRTGRVTRQRVTFDDIFSMNGGW